MWPAQFCERLRQPVCLALLRNCLSPYAEAAGGAARLFAALLSAPRLRAGLKAELGAFYPLLLLRPLETDTCVPMCFVAFLPVQTAKIVLRPCK